MTVNYECSKCNHRECETDEIRVSGGLSRFFDVQNKRFTAVICIQCRYTEFYKQDSGALGNIFDFFT